MKLKIRKLVVVMCILLVVVMNTIIANASTTQTRQVSGSGYKLMNGDKLTTGWDGQLKCINNGLLEGDDKLYWTGNSYSKWLGSNPYDADAVTHYDILEVEGTGSITYSGGAGANASGPTANFGISGTTSSKEIAYQYSVSNDWRALVDYSYYAEIYSASWMDLFTSATFKFGSSFKVVNSRVDNPSVSRGTIYYS